MVASRGHVGRSFTYRGSRGRFSSGHATTPVKRHHRADLDSAWLGPSFSFSRDLGIHSIDHRVFRLQLPPDGGGDRFLAQWPGVSFTTDTTWQFGRGVFVIQVDTVVNPLKPPDAAILRRTPRQMPSRH